MGKNLGPDTGKKARAEDAINARFVPLFTAHSRRIHGFISMLLPSGADVDDVFQETGRVLWEKFDQFEEGTNFFAWASSIARFQTLAFLQRNRRSRIKFSTEFIQTVSEQVLEDADVLEEKHRALAECVEKLKPRDHELIQLRYSPNATTKSVAKQVGRPVGGLYKALNRIENVLLDCVRLTLRRE
ncbi:MAG: sigma-70 family RNA polymerase sigma factor [Planctomycetes bacterium]|nr:sigma-70 family RNA polymerase sigma factor [Planctomycetota bacterium]